MLQIPQQTATLLFDWHLGNLRLLAALDGLRFDPRKPRRVKRRQRREARLGPGHRLLIHAAGSMHAAGGNNLALIGLHVDVQNLRAPFVEVVDPAHLDAPAYPLVGHGAPVVPVLPAPARRIAS